MTLTTFAKHITVAVLLGVVMAVELSIILFCIVENRAPTLGDVTLAIWLFLVTPVVAVEILRS